MLQRISQLKNKVAAYTSLETAFDDTMTLIELADEEEDLSMFDECREGVTKFEDELEKQTLSTLLNGEYDAKNALLTFHAGAGGTEAQDWTQMLVRMYQHWGENVVLFISASRHRSLTLTGDGSRRRISTYVCTISRSVLIYLRSFLFAI